MFVSGVFILKIKLNNSCYRTIQISSSNTLLDLHYIIQRSFEFDDDHLYSFYMDKKKYGKNCYNSPNDHQGPFVNEAKIGGLNLFEGQTFLYLFDFGDEWLFEITVLSIAEGDDNCKLKVIDMKGKSPMQYEDFY